MSEKRQDYLTWDEYFMGVAFLSGMRSKDPNTQVGACIVSNDNKILSIEKTAPADQPITDFDNGSFQTFNNREKHSLFYHLVCTGAGGAPKGKLRGCAPEQLVRTPKGMRQPDPKRKRSIHRKKCRRTAARRGERRWIGWGP